MSLRLLVLALPLLVAAASPLSSRPTLLVMTPTGPTESAPHGAGNIYAPDVLWSDGMYRMWYGGQGRDGHDRIHYAESRDGVTWTRRGVALDNGHANHVNDPSVVRIGDAHFMFYTYAGEDVRDAIALATSDDGRTWVDRGVALRPGEANEWDALLVGRPSVVYDGTNFLLWYDGRKDLPTNAPAKGVSKSDASHRAVGLARSADGIHWSKDAANPVYGHDAGGVSVCRYRERYVMVYESHEGTCAATSVDGVAWREHGLWVPRSGSDVDRFGHVTPFLRIDPNGGAVLYVGAARAGSWDHNSIGRIELQAEDLKKLED